MGSKATGRACREAESTGAREHPRRAEASKAPRIQGSPLCQRGLGPASRAGFKVRRTTALITDLTSGQEPAPTASVNTARRLRARRARLPRARPGTAPHTRPPAVNVSRGSQATPGPAPRRELPREGPAPPRSSTPLSVGHLPGEAAPPQPAPAGPRTPAPTIGRARAASPAAVRGCLDPRRENSHSPPRGDQTVSQSVSRHKPTQQPRPPNLLGGALDSRRSTLAIPVAVSVRRQRVGEGREPNPTPPTPSAAQPL